MNESTAIKELRDVIEIDVKAGFADKQAVIENGIDFLLGDYDYDWIEAHATRITEEVLLWHMAGQASWANETDCDRLSEAFAELDRKGIVARHNWQCCQTCGHAEINYEVERAEQFRPIRGYVFYHAQDTESAVRNGYLYIAFGSVSGKDSESIAIAHEICETLKAHGLEADWNGSHKTRICIREINWQYRRVAE